MVAPQLPPGMPLGKRIQEEATFVGYFLKLQPFEDGEGKTRAAPLLIGRLVWHPTAASPLAPAGEWTWPWYLAGAVLVLFIVRMGLARFAPAKSRSSPGVLPRTDPAQLDAWLEAAEHPSQSVASNGHDPHANPHYLPPPEMTGPPPVTG
jgi:hypothetical protein